jgi:hypothetical protein
LASLEKSQKSWEIKGSISALFVLRCDRTGHAGSVTASQEQFGADCYQKAEISLLNFDDERNELDNG